VCAVAHTRSHTLGDLGKYDSLAGEIWGYENTGSVRNIINFFIKCS